MHSIPSARPSVNVNTPNLCPTCGNNLEEFEGWEYCPDCERVGLASRPGIITGYVIHLSLTDGSEKESLPFMTAEEADRLGKVCLRDPAVESYTVRQRS